LPLERDEVVFVRQVAEGAAAAQALVILKIDGLAAELAVKGFHA